MLCAPALGLGSNNSTGTQGNTTISSNVTGTNLNTNVSQNVESLNSKVAGLIQQGKFISAMKTLDEIIKLDPNNAINWYNKGAALGAQGKYNEAIQAFDKAI